MCRLSKMLMPCWGQITNTKQSRLEILMDSLGRTYSGTYPSHFTMNEKQNSSLIVWRLRTVVPRNPWQLPWLCTPVAQAICNGSPSMGSMSQQLPTIFTIWHYALTNFYISFFLLPLLCISCLPHSVQATCSGQHSLKYTMYPWSLQTNFFMGASAQLS